MRSFLLVVSLFNLRYALSVSHLSIYDFGQMVRSWWGNVKATQEGDHVNMRTQISHETNMKFRSLGQKSAKIIDYIKKLFE